MLDLEDVSGKRIIETRLRSTVTVREENSTAALEVMSRFAANPKWLIYLPPTMSPAETSKVGDLLEHPEEAFAYYRHEHIPRVICQEKHMGSRAVVVLCRDEAAAARHFGVQEEGIGIIYTRTGRRFFAETSLEAELLTRLQGAVSSAGLWDSLQSSWICLDAELMPWSAKAQELIRAQYAAVGAAASAALQEVVEVVASASHNDLAQLLERQRRRLDLVESYRQAYRRYCWDVTSINDLKLAPFHILASERGVHVDRDHAWHMQTIARLCAHDSLLQQTNHRIVELDDAASSTGAVEWWEELTSRGGEGMVVKPLEFVAKGKRGLAQPAVKVRGPEYLRIIYGPEYTEPANLERLRARGLSHKRSLALREFALSIEALERFVRGEPLRRVHECVFGVLALESEPVDPRL